MAILKTLGLCFVLTCSYNTAPAQQVAFDITDSLLSNTILNAWEPDSIEPYTEVPDIYKVWGEEISKCAKLTGDLTKIHWWRVLEKRLDLKAEGQYMFYCPIVTLCDGWTSHRDSIPNIYTAWARLYDERLIKHEMLHVLLGPKNLMSPKHHPLFKQCDV